MLPIKKTSEYNQHPNVASLPCVDVQNVGFAPVSMQALPGRAAPKHRPASAPMPCHAKAGQRSPRAALSARTAHAPALSLWLTHAQRKRTDDDDSPPWLYPTAMQRAVGVRTRRGSSPKGTPTPSVTVHCTAALGHATVLALSQQKKIAGKMKRRFSVWSVLSSIKGGRTARRA